jgi:hypothetical protein
MRVDAGPRQSSARATSLPVTGFRASRLLGEEAEIDQLVALLEEHRIPAVAALG